ncbi:MAG: rRNA maturation RNase YbeY [Anaerolineaceae bacterium]|nr:rRNA maturation RNase YbeY [Anaerolineaceae bacterium]
MIEIQQDISDLPAIHTELLQLAITATLQKFNRLDVDLTLRLTNDSEMEMLNRAFRDEPKTTDVLSFNEDYTDPETGRFYLGDIVISVDRAAIQAANQGHSLDAECAFLSIHGTLHLLGFDHYEPEEKAVMWAAQDDLFQTVMANHEEGDK